MVLRGDELIGSVGVEVGFQSEVEGDVEHSESSDREDEHLPKFDPLHDMRVLVDDLSLLKIERFVGVWRWHFDEWLIDVIGMIDIAL
jgi:hypothetical protein